MIKKFKDKGKTYYVLQGSTLLEGILREDFLFTHKELQRAAKRHRAKCIEEARRLRMKAEKTGKVQVSILQGSIFGDRD